MLRISLAFFIAAIIVGYFLYQSATAASCLGFERIGEPPVVLCEVVWIPGVRK